MRGESSNLGNVAVKRMVTTHPSSFIPHPSEEPSVVAGRLSAQRRPAFPEHEIAPPTHIIAVRHELRAALGAHAADPLRVGPPHAVVPHPGRGLLSSFHVRCLF